MHYTKFYIILIFFSNIFLIKTSWFWFFIKKNKIKRREIEIKKISNMGDMALSFVKNTFWSLNIKIHANYII